VEDRHAARPQRPIALIEPAVGYRQIRISIPVEASSNDKHRTHANREEHPSRKSSVAIAQQQRQNACRINYL